MVIAMAEAVRTSYRKTLNGWHQLIKQHRQLLVTIGRQEQRLAHLCDRLSPDGILGVFQNRPGVNSDIRPQGGHGDKVGDLVAKAEEETMSTALSLQLLRMQVQDLEDQIASIQAEVDQLSTRHQQAINLYFRERQPWLSICVTMCMSKTSIYRLLDEGIQVIDDVHAMMSE